MKGLRILLLLLWVCGLYLVGLYLFVGGFLLVRLEVNRTSSCSDVLQPLGGRPEADYCRGRPRFRRAVLLVIDALKVDFARFDPNNTRPRAYENKLPVLQETVSSRPTRSRLYAFRADAPTTTMQRIKGFTTGSLPTFIDVGNNFASSAILEDNLILQFGSAGKRVVFMGDDTWESLFPKKFHRSLPFPSFNVKDLHTVDDGILQHLYTTMEGDDWDVLVVHFLGVDHCGHRFGPDHQAMADKLTQMDGVIRSVMERVQDDTLLVVFGDHGMTDTGDHGGDSQKETDAAIFLYSPSPLFPGPPSQSEPDVVPQTDLVPTLALLLGVPIPYSSVGQILLPLFPPHGHAGTFLPASLVTLNTFASHILFAVACPLLLFWPLVCEVRGVRAGRVLGEDGDDGVMEMRLRENPRRFSSALFQLSARYLFILGAQVFSSVCAAAVLRRHLMVWKVFAPKLMFEASGFVVSSVSLLLGVVLVLRVDVAVGRWFKTLIPEASR